MNLFYDDSAKVQAPEIWKRLKEFYSKQTETQRYAAINKLLSFRYRSDKTILENLNDFKRVVYQLTEANADISQEVLCITLINKLPSDWDVIKESWLQRQKTTAEKTVSNLITALMSEAARRDSERTNDATALVTNSGRRKKQHFQNKNFGYQQSTNIQAPTAPQGPGNSQQQTTINKTTNEKFVIKCSYCKKPGHHVNQCRTLQKKKGKDNPSKGNSNKRSGSAHQAECLID